MDTLFVVDVAIISCLMVLANLSCRIGEALRIPALYKAFYVSAALVLCASFADAVFEMIPYLAEISSVFRVVAVVVSIPIAVRYWHWLFNEKLHK